MNVQNITEDTVALLRDDGMKLKQTFRKKDVWCLSAEVFGQYFVWNAKAGTWDHYDPEEAKKNPRKYSKLYKGCALDLVKAMGLFLDHEFKHPGEVALEKLGLYG